MKVMIVLTALMLSATGVIAAEPTKKAPSPAQLAQQEKMKNCNAEAGKKSLKGDERKKFMSECLSSKCKAKAEPSPQQVRMASCNADAGKKELKGDERKKFMSECLKVAK